VGNPKIILFSNSKDPINILSQMADFFYDVLPFPFSGDVKKIRGLKKIAASIIFKSSPQQSVLKKLKELRLAFPELPILIIADSPSQEEIIQAFRMGVSDFLVLPVEAGELISSLHRHTWLQKHNLKISEKPIKKHWNLLKVGYSNLMRRLRLSPPMNFSPKHIQTSLNSSLLPLPMVTGNLSNKKVISIKLLGKFKIIAKGKKEIKLKGRNSKSLLAYLILNHKKHIHREKLMNLFWPDSLPSCARNCLNVTIHNIRKAFQELDFENDVILYKDECYSFVKDHNVEIDVEQFYSNWRRGLALENTKEVEKSIDHYYKAVTYYKGDFIEDLLFEEWCELERENLKERYLVILDRLSLYAFRQGNYASTVELCNTMLKKDNCLEEIHRRLIASYRALGARDKAIRQFNKCSQTLQKELGIDPSQTTFELYEKIRK